MRLSKISTRTGDDGTTGLADGSRLGKHHARIAVLGSIDELNSQLGLLLTEPLTGDICIVLLQIQNDLFDLGGTLALPGQDLFPATAVAWLDEQLARYNADLPPLREFILPGGSRSGALSHIARTVARRAEHQLSVLAQVETLPSQSLPYLNRLSDLLFVLSRCINREHGKTETLWRRTK